MVRKKLGLGWALPLLIQQLPKLGDAGQPAPRLGDGQPLQPLDELRRLLARQRVETGRWTMG
ncbi:MAG: hypothetical protein VKN83_01750 [Cyanobacteriota bacterium]|nr:hypothetical protein [Cyanobacteriota bacterium]